MTPADQARIRQWDKDRAPLEAPGLAAARDVGLTARVAAITAWEKTGKASAVQAAIVDALDDETLYDLTADAGLGAWLTGYARVLLVAEAGEDEGGASEILPLGLAAGAKSGAYGNAIRFLRGRVKVVDEQAATVSDRFRKAGKAEAQKASLFAAKKVYQSLTQSTREGKGVAAGVAALRRAFKAAGLVPGSDHLLETIFRTQVQSAYSAGRWDGFQDPDVSPILWGFRYVGILDDRIRDTHERMDGVQRPKDDPVWRIWTPPNGYNCRCGLLELLRRRGKRSPSATARLPRGVRPDEGFSFNPADLLAGVTKKGRRPSLRTQLKRKAK